MTLKTCSECGELKELDLFYTHNRAVSGCMNKCKECHKIRQRELYNNNKNNIEWVKNERKRTREKYHRLSYKGKYVPTKEQMTASNNKYSEKYPERHFALNKFKIAVCLKKIIKKPCEVCGEKTVQGHHEDYSKPLDVNWLCVKHHRDLHVTKRELIDMAK